MNKQLSNLPVIKRKPNILIEGLKCVSVAPENSHPNKYWRKDGVKFINLFEKAIRNISPRVQLKAKRVGGATYQVPTLLNKFRSTNIAVRWIVEFSRKRSGKGMSLKLANELLEAAKGLGNSIKKKEETHKMAEANKAFAQFR